MKIGIVGFAGSGKTTLFNALTGQKAATGFGGGKVNLGRIQVPDARIDRLVELNNPKKITYAEITFADVPGGRGEQSLDSQTLGRIRDMDALVQVIRGFDEGQGDPAPANELISFEAELVLADMQVVEKRIDRLKRDRSDAFQLAALEKCMGVLENGQALIKLDLTPEERASISPFALLTLKPMLIVYTVPDDQAAATLPAELTKAAQERGLLAMVLSASFEAEIADLEPEDQKSFLADAGLSEPASYRFAQKAFELLDLVCFFTQGPDEVRAWPVRRNSTAVVAAGAVHSDIARGFIRAEVIAFTDMDKLKTEAACRDVGKLRIEGRDYIVQDGDICHFRFNV